MANGKGWAYTGALLGGAVSIAANVAHSYVPPTHAPAGWSPQPGAVIGAVFWPVAVFVAIEIMTRTPWPEQTRWLLLRYLGLLPVAAVAAIVSYQHLRGLLAFYDEGDLTATLGPLAVDGLMVMATGALLANSVHTPSAESAIAGVESALTPTLDLENGQVTPPAAPVATPALVLAGNSSETELRNAAARDQYVASLMTGAPLAAVALGEMYGRSESWARQRITEVRAGLNSHAVNGAEQ